MLALYYSCWKTSFWCKNARNDRFYQLSGHWNIDFQICVWKPKCSIVQILCLMFCKILELIICKIHHYQCTFVFLAAIMQSIILFQDFLSEQINPSLSIFWVRSPVSSNSLWLLMSFINMLNQVVLGLPIQSVYRGWKNWKKGLFWEKGWKNWKIISFHWFWAGKTGFFIFKLCF